jgi:hypothetical protein
VREKHCWLAGNQPAEQGPCLAGNLDIYICCYRACWLIEPCAQENKVIRDGVARHWPAFTIDRFACIISHTFKSTNVVFLSQQISEQYFMTQLVRLMLEIVGIHQIKSANGS